jgi:hypothetical protein
MSPLLLVPLLALSPAKADSCSTVSVQRIASAEALLDDSLEAEAIDRASIVERARILLERTQEDDADCKDAKQLHKHATRMLKAAEPISMAASLDDALMHALERVESLELAQEPEPAEIEVVRFMLAELGNHYPGDERIDALVRRAVAVQRGEK